MTNAPEYNSQQCHHIFGKDESLVEKQSVALSHKYQGKHGEHMDQGTNQCLQKMQQ